MEMKHPTDKSGSLMAWCVTAILLFSGPFLRAQQETREQLAGLLPRIPPTEAGDTLAGFRLAEGFRLELTASEPHVVDPIAMAFDELGDLYVVEMRDYPFTSDQDNLTTSKLAGRQPPGRVRLLKDTDSDGRIDQSVVFLGGLRWPTAVACHGGGVFILAPPDILYARDDDGDGKADRKEVHYSGFGRRNVQALANGLRWGPDLKLYGNTSSNGAMVKSLLYGALPAVSLSGRDFRFRPGSPIEAIPSGGGQYGVCFDDLGNRFTCSNSSHCKHVVIEESYFSLNPHLPATSTHRSIAADGSAAPVFRTSPAEPWRVVRTRWRASSANASRYARTELVPIGYFTSATGILVYNGERYGRDFQGSLLVGDVGGNLVHRKILEPDGVSFRARRPGAAERAEFISSSDNWFRPAQLVEGPGGYIYILDMYRETIEHPHSIPDSIKEHLDLMSGNERGRIYRLLPTKKPPPPRKPPGRVEPGRLASLLEADDSWTVETATRLIAEKRPPGAATQLRKLLRSSASPQARFRALWTLAAIDSLRAEDVREGLEDPHSSVRKTAVRLSEGYLQGEGALLEKLLKAAGDAAPAVRLQAAFSLGAGPRDLIIPALRSIARRDCANSWIRSAILCSCRQASAGLFSTLCSDRKFLARPGAIELLQGLAELTGARDERASVIEVFLAIAGCREHSPETGPRLFEALARGMRRSGSSLAELVSAEGRKLGSAADQLMGLFRKEAEILSDRKQEAGRRSIAARLLGYSGGGTNLEILLAVLDPATPPGVQLAAVQSIGMSKAAGAAQGLIERWSLLSPSIRTEALEMLFRREEKLGALLDALAAGDLAPAELDPARRKQLLDHPGEAIRKRSRKIFEQTARESRRAVFERLRPSLDLAANPKLGREVFKKTCATCHRAGGEGHAVAPDIETVKGRDRESLLLHLVDPNREVAPSYIVYNAILKDGRILTGIIAGETATSLELVRAEGLRDTLLRSQIKELKSTGRSLMPEELENNLSLQDIANLLDFIRGLGRKAERP